MRDMPRKRVCVWKGEGCDGWEKRGRCGNPSLGFLGYATAASFPLQAANDAQGLAVWELSAVLL